MCKNPCDGCRNQFIGNFLACEVCSRSYTDRYLATDDVVDPKRVENLDKLLVTTDGLISEVRKIAYNKNPDEVSLKMKAKTRKVLAEWWSWIDTYLEDTYPEYMFW